MITQNNQTLRRRLVWGCRRGMLELDLMLSSLAKELEQMNETELANAQSLLELSDQQLWDLLVAKTAKPSKAYTGLVENLRQIHSSKVI